MEETSIKEKCVLCGNENLIEGEPRDFYKMPVCRKCHYSLVNRRVVAYIVDILLWSLISGLVIGLFNEVMSWNMTDADVNALARFLFIILFFLKDGYNGTSVGKKLTKLRVVDADTNRPIGFGESFKRNLPLIVPFVPLIAVFQLKSGKRIGEGWANTKVIWGQLVRDESKEKKRSLETSEKLDSESQGNVGKQEPIVNSYRQKKRKMKTCSFCGEKIFAEAIKCRYCKEFLNKQ